MSESAELEPWQQRALDQYKYKGRGVVQITGRNSGKSHWTNQAIKRLMDDLNHRPVEALMFSEGRVYGSRYYCVEPIGGSWLDMEVWCLDTYGTPGDNMWGEKTAPEPGHRWYMNNRKFWFRDERDREWFTLRWSS